MPCVNSLHSVYCTLERPWVYGELKKIQQRLGKDAFPLIAQSYYPSHRDMRFDPGFPCVVKIARDAVARGIPVCLATSGLPASRLRAVGTQTLLNCRRAPATAML